MGIVSVVAPKWRPAKTSMCIVTLLQPVLPFERNCKVLLNILPSEPTKRLRARRSKSSFHLFSSQTVPPRGSRQSNILGNKKNNFQAFVILITCRVTQCALGKTNPENCCKKRPGRTAGMVLITVARRSNTSHIPQKHSSRTLTLLRLQPLGCPHRFFFTFDVGCTSSDIFRIQTFGV